MVVKQRVRVGEVPVATLGVPPTPPAPILRSPPVATQPFVAVAAVSARPAMTPATGAPLASRRRPSGLARRAPLLPFPLGRGDFLVGPWTIEQILQLVQRRGSHCAALAAVDREPERSIEHRELTLVERAGELLG